MACSIWRTLRILLVLLAVAVGLAFLHHAGAAPPPQHGTPPPTTTTVTCPWVALKVSTVYGATLTLTQPLDLQWGRFGDASQTWRTNTAVLKFPAGEWVVKWLKTTPPTGYTVTPQSSPAL